MCVLVCFSNRLTISRTMLELIEICRERAYGEGARLKKALRVEACAAKLLECWNKITANVTYYMHAAYHHLPDQIRRLPVDILDASGDTFEGKNQHLKGILRR